MFLVCSLSVSPSNKPLLSNKPNPLPQDLREAHGIFYPDKRRPVTSLSAAFPSFDFTHMTAEEDVLWAPEKRESLSEVNRRITRVFEWLENRPERNVAVVTHGVWMEECLRR